VVAVAALSALGVVLNKPARRDQASVAPVEQVLAEVTSVSEVVQRAVLPPLPERVGPLGLEMVYLAAAAHARVGGDLYEVARPPDHLQLRPSPAAAAVIRQIGQPDEPLAHGVDRTPRPIPPYGKFG
jgi:hypothetical protein